MAEKDISMVEKYVSMARKGETFNSFVFGTPMITLDKLTGSENYQSWADLVDLRFIGNGCEDHFTTVDTSIPEDQRAHWRKTDALLCNILWQSIDAKTLYNIGAYKTCYTLWNQVKKLYANDFQLLYRVISSIANLKIYQLMVDGCLPLSMNLHLSCRNLLMLILHS